METRIVNAAVVVARKGKKVLLLRRGESDPNFPGTWCFPGGHADGAENAEQTALRELAEETGLKRERCRVVAATTSSICNLFFNISIVIVTPWRDRETVSLSPEHDAWGWFTPRNAMVLPLSGQATRMILKSLTP